MYAPDDDPAQRAAAEQPDFTPPGVIRYERDYGWKIPVIGVDRTTLEVEYVAPARPERRGTWFSEGHAARHANRTASYAGTPAAEHAEQTALESVFEVEEDEKAN